MIYSNKDTNECLNEFTKTLDLSIHKNLETLYQKLLNIASNNQNHWAQDTQSIKSENLDFKSLEKPLQEIQEPYRSRIKKELFKLGPLEDLLKNPDVDEILIHEQKNISFEYKGKLNPYADYFLSESSYLRIFEIISGGFFKSISYENPTGNGYWKGFRVHVIGPPLCSQIQISLRRIGGQKIKSLLELKNRNFVKQTGFDLIQKALTQKTNILICGATSSGKTTFIQCLMNECPEDRFLILEDSEELSLPNSMSTSLICPTRSEQYCLNFSMKDLVKESLRMRPDRIVLGEARSDEAKDFIQALSTGHKGCLSSIHASSTKDALTRLECLIAQGAPNWSTPVIRQLIATGVQWIIHVEKTKDGLREVKTISEITSLEHNGFLLQDLYSSSDF
jgi:pilus assembly protein CpaF